MFGFLFGRKKEAAGAAPTAPAPVLSDEEKYPEAVALADRHAAQRFPPNEFLISPSARLYLRHNQEPSELMTQRQASELEAATADMPRPEKASFAAAYQSTHSSHLNRWILNGKASRGELPPGFSSDDAWYNDAIAIGARHAVEEAEPKLAWIERLLQPDGKACEEPETSEAQSKRFEEELDAAWAGLEHMGKIVFRGTYQTEYDKQASALRARQTERLEETARLQEQGEALYADHTAGKELSRALEAAIALGTLHGERGAAVSKSEDSAVQLEMDKEYLAWQQSEPAADLVTRMTYLKARKTAHDKASGATEPTVRASSAVGRVDRALPDLRNEEIWTEARRILAEPADGTVQSPEIQDAIARGERDGQRVAAAGDEERSALNKEIVAEQRAWHLGESAPDALALAVYHTARSQAISEVAREKYPLPASDMPPIRAGGYPAHRLLEQSEDQTAAVDKVLAEHAAGSALSPVLEAAIAMGERHGGDYVAAPSEDGAARSQKSMDEVEDWQASLPAMDMLALAVYQAAHSQGISEGMRKALNTSSGPTRLPFLEEVSMWAPRGEKITFVAGPCGKGTGHMSVGKVLIPGCHFAFQLATVRHVEIASQQRVAKVSSALGWGLAAGSVFGLAGAVVGGVLGGQKDRVTFIVTFDEHHRCLLTSSVSVYNEFLGASF